MNKNLYLFTATYYDGSMNVITLRAMNEGEVGNYIRNNPEKFKHQFIALAQCKEMADDDFKRALKPYRKDKHFSKIYNNKEYETEFFKTIKEFFDTVEDDEDLYNCLSGYYKDYEGSSVDITCVTSDSIIDL